MYLSFADILFVGAKQCGQCEGGGINIVDHYDGRFKAGASCWLCRYIVIIIRSFTAWY